MRTVILHYHLFKNAGTSVDQILRHNFPDEWLGKEFPAKGGDNSALVRDWIVGAPDIHAFSSHTMLGPLPQVPDTRIIPLLMLRDPVARIVSAYHFERQQRADTRGARLAKRHDLEGYVRARLTAPGDRQCRNFQTARLASMVPGTEPEPVRARRAARLIDKVGLLGSVASFDASMARLANLLRHRFPGFAAPVTRANAGSFRPSLPSHLRRLLEETNAEDLDLLAEWAPDAAAA
ncbi:MAG: hypothetical protein P1U53_00550 [Sulfitobacter sp.]|nr:hypothetical protein [Sulfitobacter sp.]